MTRQARHRKANRDAGKCACGAEELVTHTQCADCKEKRRAIDAARYKRLNPDRKPSKEGYGAEMLRRANAIP